MSKFTHLHNHTHYSLLDGLSRIPQLTEKAAQLEFDSMAITDHGNMYGTVEFYQECQEKGIKPIIGCEVYIAHGKDVYDRRPEDRNSLHLTLLAADNQGYRNLMQLVTFAHTKGQYYHPRIDEPTMAEYAQGIICLSGCISSPINRALTQRGYQEGLAIAERYAAIFQDRFYLELQLHPGVPELSGTVNPALLRMAETRQWPLVVTNDAHYVAAEDHEIHDTKVCLQTGSKLDDANRLRMEGGSYYLKSEAEMERLFPDHLPALRQAWEIAQSCHVDLEFGRMRLPHFVVPAGHTPDSYLQELCVQGLQQKYGEDPVARERLQYELRIVQETGFAGYFLIVNDLTGYARKESIRYGVRGSAAASVALYCLNVTNIDPLSHNLVFERFLNYERKEMPDIDLDFPDDRRSEMVSYAAQRYGKDHVAQIVSFQTIRSKQAIRDAGRVMNIPLDEVDRIARMVPAKAANLEAAKTASKELREAADKPGNISAMLQKAEGLEGLNRNVNTHPAGIIISDEPVANVTPLATTNTANRNQAQNQTDTDILPITQYNMDQLAMLGLLKMDFLGLTALTVLTETEAEIRKSNPGFSLESVPQDDAAVYDLISSGKTGQVFQMASSGITEYIKELQPRSIGELAAIAALYRPGPMEHIPQYINAKHGASEIRYPHPSMSETLDETYGVIVYQDQVLRIMQDFAGYSLGKADIVRKAMGKKSPELMRRERENFIQGAVEQGHPRILGNQVFNLIEPFAGYAFNKSHAISYAVLSYWTAYCKTHHTAVYMAACINGRLNSQNEYLKALTDTLEMGIKIKLPDLSQGSYRCTAPDAETVRLGLSAVKGVGYATAKEWCESKKATLHETQDRDPAALFNQSQIVRLGRKNVESLIRAGALDNYGSRKAILENLDQLWGYAAQRQEYETELEGPPSLFPPTPPPPPPPMLGLAEMEDYPNGNLRNMEREALGIAITPSDNPEANPETYAQSLNAIWEYQAIDPEQVREEIRIVGNLTKTSAGTTKNGNAYQRATVSLNGGEMEVMVWQELLNQGKAPASWNHGAVVTAVGTLQVRGSSYSMSAREISLVKDAEAIPTTAASESGTAKPWENGYHVTVDLAPETEPAATVKLRQILRIALEHPGGARFRISVKETENGKRQTFQVPCIGVDHQSQDLLSHLSKAAVTVSTGTTK